MSDSPIDLHRPYQTIASFGRAVGMDKGKVYRLLNSGVLTAVKDVKTTRIVQAPAAYLASLPAYKPGTMPAGPGRGHRAAGSETAQPAV